MVKLLGKLFGKKSDKKPVINVRRLGNTALFFSHYPTYSDEFKYYDPYYSSLRKDFWQYSEDQLYSSYEVLYRTNPFAHYLTEALVSKIFGDGFHFEGEGADEVAQIAEEIDLEELLIEMTRNSIIFGNGYILKNGSNLMPISGRYVTIHWIDGEKKYYVNTGRDVVEVGEDKIIHFAPKKLSNSLYGISFYRPVYFVLQALNDILGDIPAAVKRVAYAPIVAALDLEKYATEEEKQEVIQEFTQALMQTHSAYTNYVIDKSHDLRLLGAGGTGARLLPINQLIEPMITICFLNFAQPVGIFLQGDANRALIQEERKEAERLVNYFRRRISRIVETKIVPMFTDAKVKMVWNRNLRDDIELMEVLIRAAEQGLISSDEFRNMFDIGEGGA